MKTWTARSSLERFGGMDPEPFQQHNLKTLVVPCNLKLWFWATHVGGDRVDIRG